MELKVVDSKTDYCKKNDIISGELNEYDIFYKAYDFKAGDVVIIQSQPWSVTDEKIEFDFLMPVDYVENHRNISVFRCIEKSTI